MYLSLFTKQCTSLKQFQCFGCNVILQGVMFGYYFTLLVSLCHVCSSKPLINASKQIQLANANTTVESSVLFERIWRLSLSYTRYCTYCRQLDKTGCVADHLTYCYQSLGTISFPRCDAIDVVSNTSCTRLQFWGSQNYEKRYYSIFSTHCCSFMLKKQVSP